MFSTLNIENFKCLTEFSQSLKPVTLLTGFNSAGKSTVIQALALIGQTIAQNEWAKSLYLNGSSVTLGTMYDVIDRNTGGVGFNIALGTDDWQCRWKTTSTERKREVTAQLAQIEITKGNASWRWQKEEISEIQLRALVPEALSGQDPDLFKELQQALSAIRHISAERLGPREVYVAATPMIDPDPGSQGERTALCLEEFQDAPVNPGLILA